MNAGYDIYMGTLGGWISDLGNRLELVDGKTFKSTNIWIRLKDKQTFIVIAGKKRSGRHWAMPYSTLAS